MPNLRGASPVGRDDGGRSYAAWAVGRGRPGRHHDGVLDTMAECLKGLDALTRRTSKRVVQVGREAQSIRARNTRTRVGGAHRIAVGHWVLGHSQSRGNDTQAILTQSWGGSERAWGYS